MTERKIQFDFDTPEQHKEEYQDVLSPTATSSLNSLTRKPERKEYKPKRELVKGDVIELAKKGTAVKDIAATVEMSERTVYYILSDANMKRVNTYAEMTPELEGKIVQDYKEGVTLKEMKEKHNVSKRMIYTTLDQHNVPRRVPRTVSPAATEKVTPVGEVTTEERPSTYITEAVHKLQEPGQPESTNMDIAADELTIKVPKSIKRVTLCFLD